MIPVKKGQVLELKIEDLVYGGLGLAKVNGYVIFVDNSVPGQKILAEVKKTRSDYGKAKLLKVVQQSEIEETPQCKYFYHCGGCKYQNIKYEYQKKFLKKQIEDIFNKLGNIKRIKINDIIPSKKIYRYRNKMEFAFSDKRWIADFDKEKPLNFALGLRAPNNYYKAIDIDDCLIAPEEAQFILKAFREFALKNNIPCYNQKTHQGLLRHLVIRKGYMTDEVMINLVINSIDEKWIDIFRPFVETIKNGLSNLESFTISCYTGLAGIVDAEKYYTLFGRDYIHEKIAGLQYKISPLSFFQTNSETVEDLYTVIKNYADLNGNQIVWDLFSGIGTISLYIADKAKSVFGFEVRQDSIKYAKLNAKDNGINNVEFFEVDLSRPSKFFSQILKEIPSPDVMITDPPRSGMSPKLIKEIIKISPPKIVYVSCKPSTQARDISLLINEGNYKLIEIQPVDMFPHTPHVETVAKLEK